MKNLFTFAFFSLFLTATFAQEFVKGTIVTQRYDTIKGVEIEKLSDTKSLLHVNYKAEDGSIVKPKIETIKCYRRGNEKFTRVFNAGEMIMVKQLVEGKKVNLYQRSYNGRNYLYVEKVYDELIKVPTSSGKFKNVISKFFSSYPTIAKKIKNKELKDIKEIVDLVNKS